MDGCDGESREMWLTAAHLGASMLRPYNGKFKSNEKTGGQGCAHYRTNLNRRNSNRMTANPLENKEVASGREARGRGCGRWLRGRRGFLVSWQGETSTG